VIEMDDRTLVRPADPPDVPPAEDRNGSKAITGFWLSIFGLTAGPALTILAATAVRASVPAPTGHDWCSNPGPYFGCMFEPTPAEEAASATLLLLGALNTALLVLGVVLLLAGRERTAVPPQDARDTLVVGVTAAVIGLGALALTAALVGVVAWPWVVLFHTVLLLAVLAAFARRWLRPAA
jgi:hypothetical protein